MILTHSLVRGFFTTNNCDLNSPFVSGAFIIMI